ncbi:hypothetical protein MIR68_003093 [Amoeboaphelidium protococcarum]|nr:hypothetical protein MIR68_003093 [Amoeboaphelidium protococcarum]
MRLSSKVKIALIVTVAVSVISIIYLHSQSKFTASWQDFSLQKSRNDLPYLNYGDIVRLHDNTKTLDTSCSPLVLDINYSERISVSPSPKSKAFAPIAIITMLTDIPLKNGLNGYLESVRLLVYRFLIHNNTRILDEQSFEFVVLIGETIPQVIADEFVQMGARVIKVPLVHIPGIQNTGQWKDCYTKLQMFRFVFYDLIMYLDSDMLYAHRRDELFHWLKDTVQKLKAQKRDQYFAAAEDYKLKGSFNAGMFVTRPSCRVYKELIDTAPRSDLYDVGWMEQGLFNYYFRRGQLEKQPRHREWLNMPYEYNAQWLTNFNAINKRKIAFIHDKFWVQDDWRNKDMQRFWWESIRQSRVYIRNHVIRNRECHQCQLWKNRHENRSMHFDILTFESGQHQFNVAGWRSIQAYAQKQGYQFHVELVDHTQSQVHGVWNKIYRLNELLKEQRAIDSWIWIVDSDVILMNDNISLESILAEAEYQNLMQQKDRPQDFQLVITSDCNGLNAGSFMVKVSDWSRQFFQQIWDMRESDEFLFKFHEQGAISYLLKHGDNNEIETNLVVVPLFLLNSYGIDYCGVQYYDGDFLVHFPGQKEKFDAFLHLQSKIQSLNVSDRQLFDQGEFQHMSWADIVLPKARQHYIADVQKRAAPIVASVYISITLFIITAALIYYCCCPIDR